ncbi:MAG: phytochromobilin:ferredoxin oxidoreductase [Flavobacteriales bacterium]|nr:phytochromobilin:ferredoxin oxidoreductase [Flavobacteriales bacterium]
MVYLLLLSTSILNLGFQEPITGELITDTAYIYNRELPTWIIPISGWGEDGNELMRTYHNVAQKWNINIEFSSRLGTFTSYKYAPSVSKEIQTSNDKTIAVYRRHFGEDWQQRFSREVNVLKKGY